MMYRMVFLALGAFCAAMHVQLWRSEFISDEGGAPVPTPLVWHKILTAPDNSSLEIRREGVKIGFCRWNPNVGEEVATGKVADESSTPEGMVTALSNYTIDLEGNLAPPEMQGHFRFHVHVEFGSNNAWKRLEAQIGERKTLWELKASEADGRGSLSYSEGLTQVWRQEFAFDDFKDPQKLLKELDLPVLPMLMPFLMPPAAAGGNTTLSLGLNWESRQDWLRFGHSRMRTYRVQSRLFDRYSAVLHVSRVGEIMRAELPGGVVLINEALAAF